MKNRTVSRFYMIPEKLYLYPESKICEGAKLLYPLLVSLSKKTGYCYATNKYLGKYRNKSTGTISKFVSQLNHEGFIRVQITNNGSGRRIFIVPDGQITPLKVEEKEKANVQLIEDLSTSLQIQMRQNYTNNNSTTLTSNEYPLFKIQETPFSNNEHHIINTKEETKIITKTEYLKFVRIFELQGNKVYCDVDYFYTLMKNHNWKIDTEENPEDWKSYFCKFNDIFKDVDNKKYSKFGNWSNKF